MFVEQLAKSFGEKHALVDLELVLERGQIHGFLGPNGAGKTTTIRILLGLVKATSGTAKIFDLDPWTQSVQAHRRLAYVPGEVALWPNLTGGETIDVLGRLRGGLSDQRRNDLIERFALDPTVKVRDYSKGNRQKVALVAALASDVDLYILDEPTDGLDPLMAEQFREVIRQLAAEGRTVLLSSHVLAEVDAVCDYVTIIRDGRTVESGPLEQLRHLSRTVVSARTQRPVQWESLAGVHDVQLQPDQRTVTFATDTNSIASVVAVLNEAGLEDFQASPPSLEQMFLRYYREQSVQS